MDGCNETLKELFNLKVLQCVFVRQAVLKCKLMLPRPSWVSYCPQAELLGREVQWVETSEEEKWQLQASALDTACQSDGAGAPRLLIFNNPCNPTGVGSPKRHQLYWLQLRMIWM